MFNTLQITYVIVYFYTGPRQPKVPFRGLFMGLVQWVVDQGWGLGVLILGSWSWLLAFFMITLQPGWEQELVDECYQLDIQIDTHRPGSDRQNLVLGIHIFPAVSLHNCLDRRDITALEPLETLAWSFTISLAAKWHQIISLVVYASLHFHTGEKVMRTWQILEVQSVVVALVW